MAAKRLDMHRLQEMVRLYRMGTGFREICRLLHLSPNTERPYRKGLIAAGLLDGQVDELPSLAELQEAVTKYHGKVKTPAHQISGIIEWEPLIKKKFEGGSGPQAIYDYLRLEEPAFHGGIGAVKRMCVRLNKARGIRAEDVAIPVDTAAGEVAQVDFGYIGKIYDPERGLERKAWAFVFVLGFSRQMYADIVFDQTSLTWVNLHIRAFQSVGGVVKTVVPDNLKSAVIRAAFGDAGDTKLNRTYRELARHYRFKVDPAPPREPKKKGKVEAGVKYLKRNFIGPREFSDIHDARRQLKRWIEEVANVRIHGTTRRQPQELFKSQEKARLLPLPLSPYEVIEWSNAKLHIDCHLSFGPKLYSAPWQLVGQTLWIKASQHSGYIYNDAGERVATHPLTFKGRRHTTEAHLPKERADRRHRSREYWEERARAIGSDVHDYIQNVFDSDRELSKLRDAQNIVTHLETFPKSRAAAACRRAKYFGNYRYVAIKNIMKKALDLEPLPEPAVPRPSIEKARFARNPSELVINRLELFLDNTKEDNHGYH